jgi:hypothetical protein
MNKSSDNFEMAALAAAVDEDEATAIEVDGDDEVPSKGKRKRNTLNKELYD